MAIDFNESYSRTTPTWVSFVDLCEKRYDVVLMNPPFGEMPEDLLTYLTTPTKDKI